MRSSLGDDPIAQPFCMYISAVLDFNEELPCGNLVSAWLICVSDKYLFLLG